jgi:hypothetical protein
MAGWCWEERVRDAIKRLETAVTGCGVAGRANRFGLDDRKMRGRLAGGARGLEFARIEDDVIALLKLAAPLAAADVNARRDLALIVSTFLLQFRRFRQG